jgi:putative FmdB family regulatory protein
MPIYAYRCETCGHSQDILRKMSDPVLVNCPACGAATFNKQVTAAGFQLKGSGWYVTDFKSPNKAPNSSADKDSAPKPTETASTPAADAPASGPAPAASPPAAPSPSKE